MPPLLRTRIIIYIHVGHWPYNLYILKSISNRQVDCSNNTATINAKTTHIVYAFRVIYTRPFYVGTTNPAVRQYISDVLAQTFEPGALQRNIIIIIKIVIIPHADEQSMAVIIL